MAEDAQATQARLAVAAAQAARNGHQAEDDAYPAWSEPEPLSEPTDEPEDFPLAALPEIAAAAVAEYQRYGQQPKAVVASAALGVMSHAVQGQADVRRDPALVGPTSLALLLVAESGERKTAADAHFKRGTEAWAREMRDQLAPEVERARQLRKAHEAEETAILASITAERRKKGSPQRDARISELQQELKDHGQALPPLPPTPRPFIEDATPEGLLRDLHEAWPSSSWWSNEGGAVVGGHAFSSRSSMRTLALVNRVWDGQPLDRSRSTGDHLQIAGRRLTVSIMVQPIVFQRLATMHGGMARGLGTMARCLIAWPRSTMGERPYQPPPGGTPETAFPARARFTEVTEALLALPLPMPFDMTTMSLPQNVSRGVDPLAFTPEELVLTPKARNVWIGYLDSVEREMREGGEYATIRDIAAKSAENAARLAAIFHVYRNGTPHGLIDVDDMQRAVTLAAWYLREMARIFLAMSGEGESSTAVDVHHANLLVAFVIDRAERRKEYATVRDVMKGGPTRLRKKARLSRAIDLLVARGWLRIEVVGIGREVLTLNPKVISSAGSFS